MFSQSSWPFAVPVSDTTCISPYISTSHARVVIKLDRLMTFTYEWVMVVKRKRESHLPYAWLIQPQDPTKSATDNYIGIAS